MPRRPLRVAVVGAGPSGMYATGHLVEHAAEASAGDGRAAGESGIEVDVIERLPTPWGLVRAGVAPDHPEKKRITRVFDGVIGNPGVRFLGNVVVGQDLTTEELSQWYDAVIIAVGAPGGRALPVPGGEMKGCWTAHDVVAWYNGHPDYAEQGPDLSGERVVIVGIGNVAFDVARVLIRGASSLEHTDIAPSALADLRSSAVREVVLLARRGPENAAFGTEELAELDALATTGGIDLVVDPADLESAPASADDPQIRRRLEALRRIAARPLQGHHRRVVLKFYTSPVEVLGAGGRASGLVVRHLNSGDAPVTIDAGLIIASIGFASGPITGWPFDFDRHVVPTVGGRVVGPDGIVPGLYATGWVKRGPTGMIGTNKACARETVAALVADVAAGRLVTDETLDAADVVELLQARKPEIVSWAGWRRIDVAEQLAGQRELRPRVKLTDVRQLLTTASGEI